MHPKTIVSQSELGALLVEKYERHGWPSLPRPDCLPPAGWDLSLLTAVHRIHHPALSPDGASIAFVWDRDDLSDLYVMPAAGGWPRRLTTGRAVTQYWWDDFPQWSPDSRWLAFNMKGHVYVAAAASGLPRCVTDFAPSASSPAWMPDSNGLVVTVERGELNHLLLTDRAGSWPRPLAAGFYDDSDPRPSPDGRSILFVRRPMDDLNCLAICRCDLDTGQCVPLVHDPGRKAFSPRWSPDGSTVAFLSELSGNDEIWLASSGGENLRRLTSAGADFSHLEWSPAGDRLCAVLNRGASLELVLVDAASGSVTPLRQELGVHSAPRWLPDASGLVFAFESPSLPPDLYRLDLSSGACTQLTFSLPPALQPLAFITPQRVAYPSTGGTSVPALLFQPARPNGAAVVYPHGGPRSQYLFGWDLFAQYLVAKGYTFLAVNYRGGTGYGYQYEHANDNNWGVVDRDDCLAAADYLKTLPWIDPARLAIYGGSFGGYLTISSLASDPSYRYACGVDLYGDADLVSSWALCDRSTSIYSEMQLGHPSDARAVYDAGSMIARLSNIQKPLLILHGIEDWVVPLLASEEIVSTLKQACKTFEYKTYAGESHGFLTRRVLTDVYTRIERFLDWYLMPAGKRRWPDRPDP